jgi:hypothetical protein
MTYSRPADEIVSKSIALFFGIHDENGRAFVSGPHRRSQLTLASGSTGKT